MFSSIVAGLTWLAAHLWLFFVALIPSVLSFLSPLLEAITKAVSGFVSAVWEGFKEMSWKTWTVTLTVAAITFGLGYHYGWNACLDWAHAHFRWIAKMPVSHWWKLW